MIKSLKALIVLLMLLEVTLAEEAESKVTIDQLNSGKVVIIGKLGSPIGTYHDIVASFGMPAAKGRAGQGGQILLKVTEVDGKKLEEPLWLPYFKSMTLQDYLLPDGTDIFPRHPKTHILNGKTIACRVYEDVLILDGGSPDFSEEKSKEAGFEKIFYKSALGIISINGPKK